MDTERAGQVAAILNDGTVLVAGGGVTDSAELYELIGFAPSSVSFANQLVNVTSPSQNVTLTNNQSAALNITSIAITGGNAVGFAETNNCPGSVPAGATCSISVSFTPATPGTRVGSLTITDTLPVGGPLTVPLFGTGVAPAPIVSLSSNGAVFAMQALGTTSSPQTVTVRNTGNAALNIQTVALAGSNSGDFAIASSSTCANGTTVAINGSCAIQLTVTPTAVGARSATVSITDNAADSPETISLSGSGTDFSMTPGSASSATVSPGQTASYSIAVAPAGGFAASVALACSGAPAQSTCTVSPTTIALSGTAAKTAMVTVTTVAGAQGPALPFGIGWPMKYRPMRLVLTWIGMFLAIAIVLSRWRREQRIRWAPALALVLLVSLGMTLTSCGGGSSSGGGGGGGTQAGTYAITVTGNFTSGSSTLTHTTKLTLVVQ
jgi:hypothetical protein